MAKITRESLAKEVAGSPVARKFAKRISLLEAARKVSGAAPMTDYQKHYAGQLFENISRGSAYNLNEAYTQPGDAGNFIRRDIMNITSIAVQNSVLPEVVSVQAMTSEYQALPLLQFKYGTDKGAVRSGDVILDSTGAGHTDKDYDSSVVAEATVPAGTNVVLAPFTPVVPGSVKITVGTDVYTDDGEGNITKAGAAAGTIDYAAGTATLTSTTTADGKLEYKYDNTIVPNYLYPEIDDHGFHQVGDVTFSIQPVEMKAEEHKLRALYALTAGYRFNKEFGIDLPMEFNRQVANEMNKEKEYRVISDLFVNAAGGNAVVWSRTPRPGVSDKEHIESLPIAINEAAAELYANNGKHLMPNFIAAGANVVAILSQTIGFKANEAPQNGGSYLAGMLGNKRVYLFPSMGVDDFLLGVVGNEFWEAGYIVGDYMPLTKTGAVTLADFTTQEGWVSIYANKMVNDKFYLRGRITV